VVSVFSRGEFELRRVTEHRAMVDSDGPLVAKLFYEGLFARESITAGDIPYALDDAVAQLRKAGVPPERWATFVHIGA
jgi:hypothetical protein